VEPVDAGAAAGRIAAVTRWAFLGAVAGLALLLLGAFIRAYDALRLVASPASTTTGTVYLLLGVVVVLLAALLWGLARLAGDD